MELTQEEKDILVQLLYQVSLPVKQAPIVLEIIKKLQTKIVKKES